MALKPPSPQNPTRRLKFFEDHPEWPNAKVESYKIKCFQVIKDHKHGKIRTHEANNKLNELFLAFSMPRESEMKKV